MTITINNSFKQVCLSIYIVFSFRGLLNTPIEGLGYIVENGLSVGVVLFFFFYIIDLVLKKALKPIHLLGVFLCSMPIIAAISANLEFGQPVIYGFLAQRDYFLILTPYVILYLLEIQVINLELLEKVFVKLSWIFLIAFYLVVIFVDPEPYIKTGIVGYKEIKGGYIFRFQMVFILFGAIYYVVKSVSERKSIYLLYSSLFIVYVVLIRQDRTIVLFMLLTIFILLFKNLSLRRILNLSLILGVLVSCVILYGSLIKHDGISQLNDLYYQTYLTLAGEDIPGQKVNVRWQELETAMKYIKKNPVWGSGELSKQWNNGFERLGHFYPSDIGVFGVVFVYGIGGFLVACSQILYFIILNKRTDVKRYVFLSSLKYSILLFYLNSFSDGSLMTRTAIGMTMILIFYFYTTVSNQKTHEIS